MITFCRVIRGSYGRIYSFFKLNNCSHSQISSIYSSSNLLQRNFPSMAKSPLASSVTTKPQKFDYFLVLDFEATCDNRENIHPQEIIEFPVLKVNSKTLETESIFHHYVEPDVHNKLTSFCIELTGIVQDMVDGRPHITEVLQMLDKWMQDEGLLKPDASYAFVTCGDWDLKKIPTANCTDPDLPSHNMLTDLGLGSFFGAISRTNNIDPGLLVHYVTAHRGLCFLQLDSTYKLPSQCDYLHLPVKGYFKNWINIKKAFADLTGMFPRGMQEMLSHLGIPHQGRHHSGIDDCKNIANILIAMLRRGYVFKITGSAT